MRWESYWWDRDLGASYAFATTYFDGYAHYSYSSDKRAVSSIHTTWWGERFNYWTRIVQSSSYYLLVAKSGDDSVGSGVANAVCFILHCGIQCIEQIIV